MLFEIQIFRGFDKNQSYGLLSVYEIISINTRPQYMGVGFQRGKPQKCILTPNFLHVGSKDYYSFSILKLLR